MAFQVEAAAGWFWSSPAGQVLSTNDFDSWQLEGARRARPVKVYGWPQPSAMFAASPLRVTIRAPFNDSSATPPVPDGTVGTLTLYFKASTKGWAFNASLYNFRVGVGGRDSSELYYYYDAIQNAQAPTDAVTVT